jgi:hypothetical protein
LSCSGGEKEGDFCCGEGIGNFQIACRMLMKMYLQCNSFIAFN